MSGRPSQCRVHGLQGGMLLSASYVCLWLAQRAWDYAVEVRRLRSPPPLAVVLRSSVITLDLEVPTKDGTEGSRLSRHRR